MFRCLAHLGVVVAGFAIVACWGCAERSPKGTSPAKKPEQAAKGDQPVPKDTKPSEAKPEKPAAGKPGPGEEKPSPAEAGSTSGRSGRAVGKVLKRLMEKSEEGGKVEGSALR